MATKIVTKNSSTASAAPTASDLVQGELAVNVTDKRLYTENASGAIVELGTNPSTIDINAGTIDGTVIGGATPAAISGTTGTFNSTVTAQKLVATNGILELDDNGSHNGVINVPASLFVNIDSDNSNTGEIFVIAKDRTSTSGGTELFKVQENGNVGIGTAAPASLLHVNDPVSGNFGGEIRVGGTGSSRVLRLFQDSVLEYGLYATGSSTVLKFGTAGSSGVGTERMRIDSSGNLLVGKTSEAFGTQGLVFRGNPSTGASLATFTRNGNNVVAFNRLNSDGSLLNFHKDGTTVGSIGSLSNHLHIGNGDTSLRFIDSLKAICPLVLSASSDAALDLGRTAERFKDLYLSGVMAAGNGSASAPSVRGTDTNTGLFFPSGGVTCFTQNGVERGRWAASGNLLVGGTADRGGRICVGGTSSTARILPQTDNVGYIGQSNFRWQALFAVNGTVQTSDEREKTEIKPTTLGLEFIKDLRPVSYKWIDGEQQDKGKDKREHQGLIAQQVAKAVEKHGIDKNAFGGLDIQKTDKYDDFHGMQYDQLIAPLIKAVQEQQDTIESLTARIAALEE